MVVRSGGDGEEEEESVESGDPIGACAFPPRPESRAIRSALPRAMVHWKIGREGQYLPPKDLSIRFAGRRAASACERTLAWSSPAKARGAGCRADAYGPVTLTTEFGAMPVPLGAPHETVIMLLGPGSSLALVSVQAMAAPCPFLSTTLML